MYLYIHTHTIQNTDGQRERHTQRHNSGEVTTAMESRHHSDLGRAYERKHFTDVIMHFDQETNVSVQPYSDADKGYVREVMPIIRSRKLSNWGDSKIDWITESTAGEIIKARRKFKGDGSLRSTFRSLELMNAYCVIISSASVTDPCGNVNIANVAGNVWSLTLVEAATRKWPLYSVGYYVRINDVDYPVTVRSSDSVIRVDATGLTALSPQTNVAWEMWGYPKNEFVKLIDLTVKFDFAGEESGDYKGAIGEGGENA